MIGWMIDWRNLISKTMAMWNKLLDWMTVPSLLMEYLKELNMLLPTVVGAKYLTGFCFFPASIWGRFTNHQDVLRWRWGSGIPWQKTLPYRKCWRLDVGDRKLHERKFKTHYQRCFRWLCKGETCAYLLVCFVFAMAYWAQSHNTLIRLIFNPIYFMQN